MKALLDTHTFLWWITEDPKLSSRVRRIISNIENEIVISAVSGWEMVIKAQIGRLKFPEDPVRFIQSQIQLNAFISLPIEMKHVFQVFILPDYHKDPFDRLLIAQAQVEGLPILTADSQISRYFLEVIW